MKNILTTWAVLAVAFLLIGCEKKAEIVIDSAYLEGDWNVVASAETVEEGFTLSIDLKGKASFSPKNSCSEDGRMRMRMGSGLLLSLDYDYVSDWIVKDGALIMTTREVNFSKLKSDILDESEIRSDFLSEMESELGEIETYIVKSISKNKMVLEYDDEGITVESTYTRVLK